MNSMIMVGSVVAFYLRSAAGGESHIREQRSGLMEVVRRHNLQVVGEYVDVKGSRNALEAMVADISKKGVQCVLTRDPSRLTRRGLDDFLSIIQRLEGEGAHVHFCDLVK
jgi:DNA invertase Pin-like site-specific DNA recombinase